MKPRMLALIANSLVLFALVLLPLDSMVVAETQATFTVNASTDMVDFLPGDGVCETATGSGMCTLRAAIMEANARVGEDTISLPAAIYSLTIPGAEEDLGATGDLDITESLTILGDGPGDTIIDAEGLGDRALDITSAAGEVNISGVKIQNGSVLGGGGGISSSATLTLSEVHLILNHAQDGYGGAIYSTGSLTLMHVLVQGNSAGAGGGGITSSLSPLSIEDSQFRYNSAETHGGAINSGIQTTVHIARTEFTGNSAVGNGGAIYVIHELEMEDSSISEGDAGLNGGGILAAEDSKITLVNVSITSNHAPNAGGIIINPGAELFGSYMLFDANAADFHGGAIYNQDGDISLYRSVLSNNSAYSGGVIYTSLGVTTIQASTLISNTATLNGGSILNGGNLTIKRSTVSANEAQYGGGIYNVKDLWIENSTIHGNHSTTDGGGIYNAGSHAYIYNSTISANLARSTIASPSGHGGGVYDLDSYTFLQNTILYGNHHRQMLNFVDDDCYGRITSGDYNLVGTLSNCTRQNVPEHDLIGEDPLLGELADNGGPTHTIALPEGSPAIDGANPDGCRGIDDILIYYDQTGVDRSLDGDRDGAARCDIGAFELSIFSKVYLPLVKR